MRIPCPLLVPVLVLAPFSSGPAARGNSSSTSTSTSTSTGEEKKWGEAPAGVPVPGAREVPRLHFVALHTGDALAVFGDAPAASQIAFLLRCRATGDVAPLAPGLGKLLARSAAKLGAGVVEIVAGYRSPKFNEQLRKKGREVASESFHRTGRAIDWRLRGVPIDRLHRYLKRAHAGGLGFYRASNFVHTDTGRRREWRGR